MFVEVALPVPLARTFTYRVEGEVAAGTRVRVQFGSRRLIGWVVGPARRSNRPPDRVRTVDRVLEERPSVTPDLLALCRWVADYYLAPLGVVLRTALPAALAETGRTKEPVRTRRVVRLTRELPSLQQREELFGRARRQRECYEAIEAAGGAAATTHLADPLGFSGAVIGGLVTKGVAEIVDEPVTRDPFAAIAPPPPSGHRPTTEQAHVLRHLIEGAHAAQALRVAAATDAGAAEDGATAQALPPASAALPPFLLLGVTGSGKTLVYIELLKEVLRQGRGAIVLVPEIALTPQTVARFRAEFGDVVAVLHSALSDGERYDA